MPKSNDSDDHDPPQSRGILMDPGLTITISELTIERDEDGQQTTHGGKLLVARDVTPIWLNLSWDHLLAAAAVDKKVTAANAADHSGDLSSALLKRTISGMQSIVATAIAVEAFEYNVRERFELPASITAAWTKNRTAKFKRVTEALRQAFSLGNDKAEAIRKMAEEIFRYRRFTVHPPADARDAVFEPQFSRHVEWRHVAFGLRNAAHLHRFALLTIRGCAEHAARAKTSRLRNYAEGLATTIEGSMDAWQNTFPGYHAETIPAPK